MPNLTRRELLTGGAGLITTILLPDKTAQAQGKELNPPVKPNATPQPIATEHLPNNLTRMVYASHAPSRPDLRIRDKEGNLIFARVVSIGQNSDSTSSVLTDALGAPESFTAPPYTYDNFDPLLTETRIWANKGVAAVIQKSTERVLEIHGFFPNPDVSEYIKNWVEGDFDPDAPKHPLGLVLIDGLGSNSRNKTFEHFEKDLFPYYQKVAKFSYAGNDKAEYGEANTFQSIYKSAEILKDMVDKLKAYQPLDILAYSLGGAVLNTYLANYVLPVDGIHKEGVIRKIVTLHSPIHGISLTTTANIDSLEELNALAKNPDITAMLNNSLAKALRNKRGIGILNLGNESDCIVPPAYTVNIGFGKNIDLGRGERGIERCEDLLASLFPDGKIPNNAGHTQLLSDYGTIKTVEKFFKSS